MAIYIAMCLFPTQLFVKATRLEQIQNDYERAQEDQALMKKSIERKETVTETNNTITNSGHVSIALYAVLHLCSFCW